jgi:hypothetical protein
MWSSGSCEQVQSLVINNVFNALAFMLTLRQLVMGVLMWRKAGTAANP